MNLVLVLAGIFVLYVVLGGLLAYREWLQKMRAQRMGGTALQSSGSTIVDPGIYDEDYYTNASAGGDLDSLPIFLQRCFDIAQPGSGEKVLDVGCGLGRLAGYCAKRGCFAVALDYSESACALARKTRSMLPEALRERMTVLKMDFRSLPEDHKYDVIFMTDLVEHLYDWQLKELFSKVSRILTPETGRVVIHTAPNRYYIDGIFPLRRILSWPSVIRRQGPKGSFFYTRNKYFFDPAMHVNEQTPGSLRRHLKGFDAKVWCDGCSSNVLSMMTRSFAGADIWAIATSSRNK